MSKKPKAAGDSAFQIIRTEGWQSYQNRKADEKEEVKRQKNIEKVEVIGGKQSFFIDPPPVLNILPNPPVPGIGGSPVRTLSRLAVERTLRPMAIAFPRDGEWWLEMWLDENEGILSLGSKTNVFDMIVQAARLVRTKTVHIEDLRGLPMNLAEGLAKRDLKVVLSIHDFTLFCRRPELIEASTGRFCGYCDDMDRCTKCLRSIDPERRYPQTDYRRAAIGALNSARVLIYPSVFLKGQYETLFRRRHAGQKELVMAPAVPRPEEPEKFGPERPNVAFVGGASVPNGAALVVPTMDRVRSRLSKATGLVYGQGVPEIFRHFGKSKGVRVRGYYRQGTLASLFARDSIKVAVLPSIWPEGYGLVADECLAAGVPVITFEGGAVADRLVFRKVGGVVELSEGADGLARSILEHLSRPRKVPDGVIKTIPQINRAAKKYRDLYRALKYVD